MRSHALAVFVDARQPIGWVVGEAVIRLFDANDGGLRLQFQSAPNLRDFVAFKYSVARCSKKLARDQFSASITPS